ncbi:hypothetical protein ACFL54_07280 [Planctomycetota bacterium]
MLKVIIQCPRCHFLYKISDDILGREIMCTNCMRSFETENLVDRSTASVTDAGDLEQDTFPAPDSMPHGNGCQQPHIATDVLESSVLSTDIKQCLFCAEDIKSAATKCKHCRSMLNNTGKSESNKEVSLSTGRSSAKPELSPDTCSNCGGKLYKTYYKFVLAPVAFVLGFVGLVYSFLCKPYYFCKGCQAQYSFKNPTDKIITRSW